MAASNNSGLGFDSEQHEFPIIFHLDSHESADRYFSDGLSLENILGCCTC